MKKLPKVSKRPAEYGAAGILPALTGVLIAFGIDPVRAAAIAGVVTALTPMVITWAREKGWL